MLRNFNNLHGKVLIMTAVRTRLWLGEFTSTAVQYREDLDVRVWLHSNLGWFPISNLFTEQQAEELAKGYKLVEADHETAREYL